MAQYSLCGNITSLSHDLINPLQVDSSLEKYALDAATLVAMLLRSMGSCYDISLPVSVSNTLWELERALLSSSPQDTLSRLLHSIFLALWTTKWNRSDHNLMPDPTERVATLLSLKPDGGFQGPHLITQTFAHFQWCIRLTIANEIRSIASSSLEDKTQETIFYQFQGWVTTETSCTFNTMKSLQRLASSFAFTTQSLPVIWWTDKVHWKALTYEGDRVTIPGLITLLHKLEDDIVHQWVHKVLMGLEIRVDYGDSHVADDLRNTNAGYSFLIDSRNEVFKDKDRLTKAFIQDPSIFRKLGTRVHGEIEWNKQGLLRWLEEYAKFEEMLLLRTEMLGGSAARGTELTGMKFTNTRTLYKRNLVVLGKHITILRTYTKGSSMTGLDKQIPHCLDAVTGDLMVQDLALARPFAQLVVHYCFPNNEELMQQYKSSLFVNQTHLFDTDDITRAMKHRSLEALGWPMRLRDWRHISIAFKKMNCKFTEGLLEESQVNEDVNALQAGHTTATENRVYGLSPEALAGTPEHVIPLFLEASIAWQKAMETVPGGLGLPFTDARHTSYHEKAASGLFGPRGSLHVQSTPACATNLAPGGSSDTAFDTSHVVTEVISVLKPYMQGIQSNVERIRSQIQSLFSAPPPHALSSGPVVTSTFPSVTAVSSVSSGILESSSSSTLEPPQDDEANLGDLYQDSSESCSVLTLSYLTRWDPLLCSGHKL